MGAADPKKLVGDVGGCGGEKKKKHNKHTFAVLEKKKRPRGENRLRGLRGRGWVRREAGRGVPHSAGPRPPVQIFPGARAT